MPLEKRDESAGEHRERRHPSVGRSKVGTGGSNNHSRTLSSRNRRKHSSSQQRQHQYEQKEQKLPQLSQQQKASLDGQAERDKCKKPDKCKLNKKILQIQLPDKAQPQLQLQLEQQQPAQNQIEGNVSQNLTNSSQKASKCEASEWRAQQPIAHNIDASVRHSSSSDASTASCDSDSDGAVSEKLASMCHHCLRPQIELQLRHLRPQQRRHWSRLLQQQRSKLHSSKSHKEVNWSDGKDSAVKSGGGGPVGVGIGGYAASDYIPPMNTYTTGAHWSRRDVSAAVRYRCPQVGPKPAPYHFHHPQQLHNAYQLQLLLQQCEYVPPTYYNQQQQQQEEHPQQLYYRRQAASHNNDMNYNASTTTTAAANTATAITIECDSQTHLQKQQQQEQKQQELLFQQQRNQNIQPNQNLHTMTTATTTIKTATSSGYSDIDCTSNASLVGGAVLTAAAAETRVALQAQAAAMPLGRSSRGTVSDSELQLQQLPGTSESPSLVKKFERYFSASCSEHENNANGSPW